MQHEKKRNQRRERLVGFDDSSDFSALTTASVAGGSAPSDGVSPDEDKSTDIAAVDVLALFLFEPTSGATSPGSTASVSLTSSNSPKFKKKRTSTQRRSVCQGRDGNQIDVVLARILLPLL